MTPQTPEHPGAWAEIKAAYAELAEAEKAIETTDDIQGWMRHDTAKASVLRVLWKHGPALLAIAQDHGRASARPMARWR